MRLATVRSADGSKTLMAAVGETWFSVAAAVALLPPGVSKGLPTEPAVADIARLGEAGWEMISNLGDLVSRTAPAHRIAESALRFAAPHIPGKIIGVGHNFRDLLAAVGAPPPAVPKLFAKWPTTLIGDGDALVLPPGVLEASYEVELAVVIGQAGRDIPVSEAPSHVFGYTVADDVTAGDVLREDGGQLTRGKNYDGFLPLGPWIRRATEVDTRQAALRLHQNGIPRQDSSTKEMVHSVWDLVAFVSSVVTLQPGDVILTGSPAGVARFHTPPAFLAPGDEIVLAVEGVGTLHHGVAAPPGSSPSAKR